MKTEKEISREQMAETCDKEHSVLLFEKKTAKLFLNFLIKGAKISYSVLYTKTHKEEYFELLGEAAGTYNHII